MKNKTSTFSKQQSIVRRKAEGEQKNQQDLPDDEKEGKSEIEKKVTERERGRADRG